MVVPVPRVCVANRWRAPAPPHPGRVRRVTARRGRLDQPTTGRLPIAPNAASRTVPGLRAVLNVLPGLIGPRARPVRDPRNAVPGQLPIGPATTSPGKRIATAPLAKAVGANSLRVPRAGMTAGRLVAKVPRDVRIARRVRGKKVVHRVVMPLGLTVRRFHAARADQTVHLSVARVLRPAIVLHFAVLPAVTVRRSAVKALAEVIARHSAVKVPAIGPRFLAAKVEVSVPRFLAAKVEVSVPRFLAVKVEVSGHRFPVAKVEAIVPRFLAVKVEAIVLRSAVKAEAIAHRFPVAKGELTVLRSVVKVGAIGHRFLAVKVGVIVHRSAVREVAIAQAERGLPLAHGRRVARAGVQLARVVLVQAVPPSEVQAGTHVLRVVSAGARAVAGIAARQKARPAKGRRMRHDGGRILHPQAASNRDRWSGWRGKKHAGFAPCPPVRVPEP